jgi:L-cysteine:1D-myo-inositol 2-amino-2-deoxy-alpha-D-glucopyranoside ligase
MVAYQGQKMSKSLGNLVFVSALRDAGVDPMAIRLAILAHHYRSDWEWATAVLANAEARLTRWRTAVSRTGTDPAANVPAADDVLCMVRERLAEDLDAPGALAAIDAWADAALAAPPGSVPSAEARLIRDTADALLGIAL